MLTIHNTNRKYLTNCKKKRFIYIVPMFKYSLIGIVILFIRFGWCPISAFNCKHNCNLHMYKMKCKAYVVTRGGRVTASRAKRALRPRLKLHLMSLNIHAYRPHLHFPEARRPEELLEPSLVPLPFKAADTE